jgi:hypothetical protein
MLPRRGIRAIWVAIRWPEGYGIFLARIIHVVFKSATHCFSTRAQDSDSCIIRASGCSEALMNGQTYRFSFLARMEWILCAAFSVLIAYGTLNCGIRAVTLPVQYPNALSGRILLGSVAAVLALGLALFASLARRQVFEWSTLEVCDSCVKQTLFGRTRTIYLDDPMSAEFYFGPVRLTGSKSPRISWIVARQGSATITVRPPDLIPRPLSIDVPPPFRDAWSIYDSVH